MNDTNAGPVRIYSPLFKNLNTGDSIVFQVAAQDTNGIDPMKRKKLITIPKLPLNLVMKKI